MATPVGGAEIVISPELSKAGLATFRSQLKAATSSAARAASASLKQEFGALPQLGNIGKQMASQRALAQQELRRTTRVYQGEADAWKSLQRQKSSALAESARQQKMHMQSLSRSFDTQLVQLKNSLRDGEISQRQYVAGTRNVLSSAKEAGLSIDDLARKKASLATLTRTSFSQAMTQAGSMLSQVATRTGMLGYQMQLLGRTMTTFVSGPVALALGGAAAVGIKQAASIEAAVKGIKALNPEKNIIPSMNKMIELAEKSPVFEVGGLLQGIQGLVANGMGLDKAMKVMEAMGNIGLTVGTDPQRMSRALYAFTQVASKGKLMTEEFRQQIAEAVPGMAAVLAEGLGKPLTEIAGLLNEGGISAEEFFDAVIKAGSSGKYLQGAQEGVTSLNSAWAELTESVKNALARAFLTDELTVRPEILEGLRNLGEALRQLIDAATNAGVFEGMISAFVRFTEILSSVVNWYSNLSEANQGLIVKFGALAAAIGPLLIAFAPLFTTIGMLLNSLGSIGIVIGSLANPIGLATAAIVGALGLVGAIFTALMTKAEPFRKRIMAGLVEVVNVVDNHVVPAFNGLWIEVVRLGRSFKNMGIDWSTVAGWIVQVIKGFVFAWSGAIQTVKFFIQWFTFLVDKVLWGNAQIIRAFNLMLETSIAMMKIWSQLPIVGKHFAALGGKMVGVQESLNGMASGMEAFGATTENVDTLTFSFGEAIQGLKGGISGLSGETLTLNERLDELAGKLAGARGEATSLWQSDQNLKRAQEALANSVKRNKDNLDENTVAGRENRAMVEQLVNASEERMLLDIKSGTPMEEAIRRHKARTEALKGEFSKSKETQAAITSLIDEYGDVPTDVRTLLKMLGYEGVQTQLEQLQIQQLTLKNGGDAEKARQEYNGLLKKRQNAMEYARYGYIPKNKYDSGGWTGPGGKYDPAGIVHADEFVVKKEARNKFERMHPRVLDHINRTGQLPPQYAKGGKVQNWPFGVDLSNTKIDKDWANAGLAAGFVTGGGSGGIGQYRSMFEWIRSKVPGTRLTSGYRPGDWGYHGKGRAVDLTFSDGSERTGGGLALKAFNIIKGTFMKSIKELIWDFAKGQAVWNGQNHFFTGPSAGPGTHNDHIHWAHDNGGPYYDGMVSKNMSGKTELVLNNAQAAALEDRIRGEDNPPEINVYIGNEKISDIARVEIKKANGELYSAFARGRGK
jgi:tape measure domain-containing protein